MEKNKIIAICGLVCSDCGAFKATQENDDAGRKKVAEEWSKEYHLDVKPEDVNCNSCISESEPVFSYCHVCEIRTCGRGRKVRNCASCTDYPCEKLEKFFKMAPNAKSTLEEIRRSI